MQSILQPQENAWEFEIYGSARTDKYDDWYASAVVNISFLNVVVKGKYEYSAYQYLRKRGIDFSDIRSVMNYSDRLKWKLQNIRSAIFRAVIPPKLRRRIRAWFTAYHKMGK